MLSPACSVVIGTYKIATQFAEDGLSGTETRSIQSTPSFSDSQAVAHQDGFSPQRRANSYDHHYIHHVSVLPC